MMPNAKQTMEKYEVLFWLLFLTSRFAFLKADISIREFGAYAEIAHNEKELNPIPEQCKEILNAFAEYASNLTKCSIQYSRPIRLCERCIDHYVLFDETYKQLWNMKVNGTSCRSIFISQDRLDAVLEFHDNIAAVWNKGNCNDCFDWTDSKVEISNVTKHFNNLFNDTTSCIFNNRNKYNNNSEEVCNKCMRSYLELDEYYNSLSPDAIGVDSICMDIVDSMNATRAIWSKELNCCQLRKTPELIFLCCTGIISSLPILFYLAVRFCGPMRDLPKVLRQSRFNQRFLRSVNANIN